MLGLHLVFQIQEHLLLFGNMAHGTSGLRLGQRGAGRLHLADHLHHVGQLQVGTQPAVPEALLAFGAGEASHRSMAEGSSMLRSSSMYPRDELYSSSSKSSHSLSTG